MSSFYETLLECIATGEPLVYAAVVKTSGSTPQKAGAKAVFLTDGRVLGTIGGGCLEAETQKRAMESLRDQKPRLFELSLNDDFGWDDGLICGGTASIFVDPQVSTGQEVFKALLARSAERERSCLVTVVQSSDEALVGSYHLVVDPGIVTSRPLPEEMVADVQQIAREAVGAEKELWREIPSVEGTVIYLDPVVPRPILLIVGAGHVGAALCRIASWLGFDVVVADDRASFANRERLPDAWQVIVEDPPSAVRDYPICPDTYIVIVTRGHRHDAKTLQECVNSHARYIGMIGSRRKVTMIFRELVEEGCCTEERLQDIHAPIGLDIGAQSVQEIAVSIAAELVQVRRERLRVKGAKAQAQDEPCN